MVTMSEESLDPYAPVFILTKLLHHKANGTLPLRSDFWSSSISTTWSLNRAIRQYARMIRQRNLLAYRSSDAFNDALARLEVLIEKWGYWGNVENGDVPLLRQRLGEYEHVVRDLNIGNRAVLAAAWSTGRE